MKNTHFLLDKMALCLHSFDLTQEAMKNNGFDSATY